MHSTEAELYTYKNTYQTETQILGGKGKILHKLKVIQTTGIVQRINN